MGRKKERGIEMFVVFTHRTSIGRWSHSECLVIMTLENAEADKNVCVKLSSMGRQGDFLFNLVIGMSLHFNLCNYRYNFNFTSN